MGPIAVAAGVLDELVLLARRCLDMTRCGRVPLRLAAVVVEVVLADRRWLRPSTVGGRVGERSSDELFTRKALSASVFVGQLADEGGSEDDWSRRRFTGRRLTAGRKGDG